MLDIAEQDGKTIDYLLQSNMIGNFTHGEDIKPLYSSSQFEVLPVFDYEESGPATLTKFTRPYTLKIQTFIERISADNDLYKSH